MYIDIGEVSSDLYYTDAKKLEDYHKLLKSFHAIDHLQNSYNLKLDTLYLVFVKTFQFFRSKVPAFHSLKVCSLQSVIRRRFFLQRGKIF